jgi:hypothetical protein
VTLGRALLLIVAAGSVLASAGTSRAVATDEPWPRFVPVTTAERRATRPLADAVVTAYRSGRFSALCSMFSRTEVERAYGSLRRCRRTLDRRTHAYCARCRFRVGFVLGVYETERDKALGRKTLVWLYAIRSPTRSGDLEISVRREHGRWILLPHVTGSWSG